MSAPKIPDRDSTERRLEAAALRMLERDGVLTGLNLREVADDAGVNRGFVYHYYGSRQQLLRAALRRDIRSRLADIMSMDEPHLVRRLTSRFRAVVRHREAIKLLALLSLDGDSHVRVVYAKDITVPELVEGMNAGVVPSDIPAEALLAAYNAMVFGYGVFRQRYLDELGLGAAELDRHVERAMQRLVFGNANALQDLDGEASPSLRGTSS